MCCDLPYSQRLIISGILLATGLLFPFYTFAQDSDVAAQAAIVVPPPRTITAAIPPKAPERVVELYFFDADNHICVDTYKLSLGRSVIVKNTTINAKLRISRKCDDKVKNAPVPDSAVVSTRIGNKSGSSQTIKPDGPAIAFTTTFPSAGNWQLTVVSKYPGGENHTVTLPVSVLAEAPVQAVSDSDEPASTP